MKTRQFKKWKKQRIQELKFEPFKRFCDVCGKEFETQHGFKKRCSDECSREANRNQQRHYRERKKIERELYGKSNAVQDMQQ